MKYSYPGPHKRLRQQKSRREPGNGLIARLVVVSHHTGVPGFMKEVEAYQVDGDSCTGDGCQVRQYDSKAYDTSGILGEENLGNDWR